jgi:hypothetical protein
VVVGGMVVVLVRLLMAIAIAWLVHKILAPIAQTVVTVLSVWVCLRLMVDWRR